MDPRVGYESPRVGLRQGCVRGALTEVPHPAGSRSSIRNAHSIHQRSRKRLSQDTYRRNSVRFMQQRRHQRLGPQSSRSALSEFGPGAGGGTGRWRRGLGRDRAMEAELCDGGGVWGGAGRWRRGHECGARKVKRGEAEQAGRASPGAVHPQRSSSNPRPSAPSRSRPCPPGPAQTSSCTAAARAPSGSWPPPSEAAPT